MSWPTLLTALLLAATTALGGPLGPRTAAFEIVLVLDEALPAAVAAGHRLGAERALAALSWTEGTLAVASLREAQARDAFPDAGAYLAHVAPNRMPALLKVAQARRAATLDLGFSRPRSAPYPLSAHTDFAAEASAAAWWLCGPFAHHALGLLHGTHPQDRDLAKAFAAEISAKHPQKSVSRARRLGGKPAAVAGAMAREMEAGVTAFFVAATASEARVAAEAARLLSPPPVVLLSAAALGYEKCDRRHPERTASWPEGTLILDLDLPTPEDLAAAGEAAEVLAMEVEGGAWALAAYDAVVALHRAWEQAAGVGPEVVRDLLGSGKITGLRADYRGIRRRPDPRALSHCVLIADDGRLRPFPALDPEDPLPRPLRAPYDPEADLGSFSRWSTLHFETHPDTIRCHFQWGDTEIRTIDTDLAKIMMSTGGRLPVVDHLVREKLMARMLSITGEKYGLTRDGSLVPGKSFRISMVARKDATRPRRTWGCFVAGDDPAAGGRAFGSYCFIYSTFIRRTIFEKYDLLDEAIAFSDLPVLTGLGQDESRPYVPGTREDVLYRLVDNFAGSMALTAAHEIGHLAGLGHDESDPHSIMNVKEGEGIAYQVGVFIDAHKDIMRNTLGTVPRR